MPAVTVEDTTPFRAFPCPLPERSAARSARSPRRPGFEGEGSRSAAPSPASTSATSTRSSTWTRWARSSTRRRAQGHELAPAPRLRDRHLHHRRHLRARRLPRRRRHDQQRRHPVDDRRRRRPAHRAPAGAPRRQRRPVPRPAALGEPAEGAEVGRAALPGPARRRVGAAGQPRRGCLPPGDRRRRRGQTGPGSTYTPMAMVHATVAPAPRSTCRGGRTSTLVYVLSGAGSVGIDGHPVRTGQLAVFGPGDTITINGALQQESRTPALDVVILGGAPDPRADRHVRAVRDEHPAGGHGRVHRLPGRPARLDPGCTSSHGATSTRRGRGETDQTPSA